MDDDGDVFSRRAFFKTAAADSEAPQISLLGSGGTTARGAMNDTCDVLSRRAFVNAAATSPWHVAPPRAALKSASAISLVPLCGSNV